VAEKEESWKVKKKEEKSNKDVDSSFWRPKLFLEKFETSACTIYKMPSDSKGTCFRLESRRGKGYVNTTKEEKETVNTLRFASSCCCSRGSKWRFQPKGGEDLPRG